MFPLWGMKYWSRQAAIIMQIIGLLLSFGMMAIFAAISPFLMMSLLIAMVPGLIISLIVILYLMQGSIKDTFAGAGAADSW